MTTATVVSTVFGATALLAEDYNAGPIWNNADARFKCPIVAEAVGGEWNGNWVTTIEGKMSLCGITVN